MPSEKQKLYAQKTVQNSAQDRPRPKNELLAEVGYKRTHTPHEVERSKGFQEVMKELLPYDDIVKIHKKLLYSYELKKEEFRAEVPDEDIKEIIESTGGKLVKILEVWNNIKDENCKRLSRQELSAKEVWFKVPNDMARDKALDKYYKLLGVYAPEKREIKSFNMSDLLYQLRMNKQLD